MFKVTALFFLLFLILNGIVRLFSLTVANPSGEKPSPQTGEGFDMMICCPTCALYVPSKHAISYKGRLFCSHEHARIL